MTAPLTPCEDRAIAAISEKDRIAPVKAALRCWCLVLMLRS